MMPGASVVGPGVQSRLVTDQKKAAILTELALVLAAFFWGANYAATKYAAEFMPPLLVVAFRFTVVAS
jgi:drug/metabolite transporter (DMT)-like permease